ncbi:CidA/LrgA family protein [Psychrobacter sp. Ps3]|uniref:CidA/LrgA family protein n=1 Tax=Psychrobacter sp. Ps3 TaxID=2790957 RepID=UPI001EE00490|nr:CidA/LrgA family protein [Psychrobacter sp. Ps3]MCG3881420.1 CidA/LrgA family protein [Psychrobacter sp. Ps3]
MNALTQTKLPLWLALLLTLAMVVIVRESALLLCQWAGIEKAANIVGLVAMFVILVVWRLLKGLPEWITRASNLLLVDSGFAFLPVSAGAGILLFELGDEFWGVMLTMAISTLIPLWGLAILANRWLSSSADNKNSTGLTTPKVSDKSE